MNVSISSDNEQFIEVSVGSGRYADSDELLNEALRLLKRRDEILHAVNAGVAQLDQGEAVDGDLVFDRLSAKFQSQSDPQAD